MKKWLCVVVVAFAFVVEAAPVFDDIEFWVGSGSNQAALVIDWNDGLVPESMLWGYRWDGSATGLEMFQAVTSTDSRFGGVVLTDHGWGWTVDGIGYDLNGNGFDISDPEDHYNPGWDGVSDYWAYWTYESNGSISPWDAGEEWTSSLVGLAERELADGSWDGWRYDDGSIAPSVAVATPIPEPASLVLLGLAAAALASRRW